MRRRLGVLLAVCTLILVGVTTSGTGAPGDPTVRFTAAGDFSASTAARAVLSEMGALNADLSLALGDLSYGTPGAEQTWCDLVTARVGAGYAFELVAGNHESNGLNGNINDFSACLPNQLPGAVGTYGRQFYVDVPAGAPLVRYVMISPGLPFPDGTWSYASGTARYAWTASAIDGARTAGIPWVVVGMHKPCLTVGQYGCESGADLMNLLLAKKVDLVLTGHEHHYARTKQLAQGPSCSALVPGSYNASCVVDADSSMVQGAGTVFATVGTGGIALRDIFVTDPEFGYFASTSGADRDPAHGLLDVSVTADTLSADFRPVSGATFTDAFAIVRGTAPNTPPDAAFSWTTDGLTVSATSTSTDPDGQLTGHAWTFGDGGTGSGTTPSHTYATAGTYDVTLTVTDDDGATDSVTHPVTVTDPSGEPTAFAEDSFERTVTGGWGTADTGGPWSLTGVASLFSVSAGKGQVSLDAGRAPGAFLGSVTSTDTSLRFIARLDKLLTPTSNNIELRGQPRRLGNGDGYYATVRIAGTGSVSLRLVRLAGTQTILQTVATGLTYQAGEDLWLRVDAVGTSPTTLRAKIWRAGTPEPSVWTAQVTDNTAGLQTAGSIGIRPVLPSTVTNAPITVSVDDLSAGPTG
ncbi:MAG TPA: PKD domain-containing protein [Nocardioidaceae bacterium]